MRGLIAFFILLLPSTLAAKAPIDRPALWKIADDDTTIWLFGTVHVLPPGHNWLEGPVERALADADELVLEADITDPVHVQSILMAKAIDPTGTTLAQRIPVPLHQNLKQRLAAAGIPALAIEHLEPWYAAMMVELLGYRAEGLVAEKGVEAHLIARARAAGKPISGLETIEEQADQLDTLPAQMQIELLTTALAGADEAPRLVERLIEAWSKGNVARLAAMVNAEMAHLPELRERLLDRRNARWAGWIARRLDAPGTLFVAVGAGHLGGPGNVRALLEAQGLKVKRIQ